MPDDRHVFESFCRLFFVIRPEHGVVLHGGLRGHPNRSAQIGRAALGHVNMPGSVFTGLIDRRINANVGSQLIRGTETGDVSDLADDRCAENRVDTGNRRDGAVKAVEQPGNFLLQFISLLVWI